MATISTSILTDPTTVANAVVANATTLEKTEESHVVVGPDVGAEDEPVRWYAAYTSANHEKRVAEHFRVREVEHFLPTYSSVRRWKDRRVTLQLPLFPGYVFVRIALRDRLRVVQVPGLARLVGFNGTPAALPKEEIAALRATLASGVRAEPHPFLTAGRRVQVKNGPMAGIEGILLKRKGRFRVVISIALIQRAVALDADVADVEVLP
jgi:transcription termination/antitermination protein NusG